MEVFVSDPPFSCCGGGVAVVSFHICTLGSGVFVGLVCGVGGVAVAVAVAGNCRGGCPEKLDKSE